MACGFKELVMGDGTVCISIMLSDVVIFVMTERRRAGCCRGDRASGAGTDGTVKELESGTG